jgi:hypothetical protein
MLRALNSFFSPTVAAWVIFTATALASRPALAQQQQLAQVPTRRVSALLFTELGSNFYPFGSADHQAYLSLFGVLGIRFNPEWRLSVLAPASKNLSGLREFTLFDVALLVGYRPLPLGPYLLLMPQAGVVLPTSERSRKRESLYFGARTVLRLMSNFSALPKLSWLSASYDLSLTKAFHEFETATTGALNSEYRISQWINVSASPSDSPGNSWRLSVDLIRSSNLSYQGNLRHSFSITETVSYSLASGKMISAGISNEGDVLRANGIDSNLAIFDPVSSRAFVSLMLPL